MINKWPERLKEELRENPQLLEDIKKSAAKVKDEHEYWSFPRYQYSEEAVKSKLEHIVTGNPALIQYCKLTEMNQNR